MLNLIELNELFDRLGTPPAGRRLVMKARREAPVRDIQSRSGNVITWVASPKMGCAIGTESRTVEYPPVVQNEHDSMVLEYYAQPCYLDLTLRKKEDSKPSRKQHIPDLLIIRSDQILIEEWKEEARLKKLAAKYPDRFVQKDDGWHFPEAEEQLAEMGITYRLRSADEHPRQFVNNLIFLSDYLSPACPPVEQKKIDIIQDILSQKAALSIADLMAILGSIDLDGVHDADEQDAAVFRSFTFDDLYKAIADGLVTFDLMNDDISETQRARIYRDMSTLAFHQIIEKAGENGNECRLDSSFTVGAEIDYDGKVYRISLVGKKSVMLTAEDGTTELSLEAMEKQYASGRLTVISSAHHPMEDESLDSIPPEYLDMALQRARELEIAAYAPGEVAKSIRTLQRYQKKMREAGESVIDQHLALVPETRNCGNRTRKIPQELIDLIPKLVKTVFNNATNINREAAYKEFVAACEPAELKPCSKRTFIKELNKLACIRSRRGKRVWYQTQPIVWYLQLEESVHGVRPFQLVHIDHTPLEILLGTPKKKESLGTVWLSLAMDAESRNVVGFYLSFEPPSYRSCMMVLRDIVRRHGRMPEMIVVDNGKEFKSRAFKRVCRLYGCSIRYRPAGQPRHGSVLERLFGTTQSQLIHNLKGNTQVRKHLRTVTKSINPDNFVEWTLPALHGALHYYFENLYGMENHPAHGEEPVKHFLTRMAETGMRLHRIVRYDRTFLIETCPEVDAGGTRVIDGQRGVKVNHIWYWSDAFRAAALDEKPVEVRIDPWDVRFVYALVKGQWQQCASKLAYRLRQYSVIELRCAFEELARKHNVKKKDLTPERIAEWLKVMDARNFDERLRDQQTETRLVYDRLGMTTVETITPEIYPDSTGAPGISSSPSAINTSSPSIEEAMAIFEEEEYELF